jgi:DNA-binding CsgD family transcriptional regulator
VDGIGDGRGALTAAGLSCRSCGALATSTAKFCSECGAALTQAGRRAEYKQVTVLFADVVRSMDIAAAVGAERLREIMADLVDRAAVVVLHFGGTVVTANRRGCSAPPTPSEQRSGQVRFKIFDGVYSTSVAALRDAMGEKDFEPAWAEGAALSTDEAIAYAQRRRGQRKRPTSGWASLTPTERDVVRLVSEGLANNDIATRVFVSPRTVQTHLTHVYAKLGLTSRVQLVKEAARHT